ncbi:MAG TPA: M36 family metallopeptidase [Vicinamibacterales bacterium]|nr:M36 family metallopeptidase [Vicinamibacterales bacterium]
MYARLLPVVFMLALAWSEVPALAQEARDFSAASARITRGPNGAALTPASAAARPEIVSAFLRARHDARTVETLVLLRENVARTGVTHLNFGQQVAGLDVYGTYARAALTARGEIVSMVENLANIPPALAPTAVTHRGALEAVLAEYYAGSDANLPELSAAGQTVAYGRGTRFTEDPTVTRIAVPMANGALQTGYLVVTWDRDNILRHSVVGPGGRVLIEELRTNTDTYKVFAIHPGVSTQSVVSGPGSGDIYSPSGWVTLDRTTGNNVDAYLDRDNNNAADTNGRPVSSTQTFEFTADLTQAPTTTTNQMAAVTNLFYLNNIIHDKLYRHGFTEAAGNFQANNFGKGGAGNDPVNAEAQDGGGTNNANFATPSDGSRPRMQMYLWTQSTPSRDGDLDSDIVWHEYGHGLTWRMIGSMSGPFAGAIGEGMSDTLAIYINDDDAVGEYSYNRDAGIRRYRYTNYPLSYGDLTGSSVHNDGEIYAAAMWKLRELWAADGRTDDSLFDIVVDGMNFTPARPAFEDMRDGIIAAAATQAEDCIVWKAFAQFGIGEGADGREVCHGFGFCSAQVTETFAVPAVCSTGGGGNTAPFVSITSPANNFSSPFGSTFNFAGTANDDLDGNVASSLSWTSSRDGAIGSGASFSTTTLTEGTHTITASATDSGGLTGSASISVTVTPAGGESNITLDAVGWKSKGKNLVNLTWFGANTATVDIYRNGVKILTTPNDNAETDSTGTKGSRTFTYKLCEANSSVCSPERTVVF